MIRKYFYIMVLLIAGSILPGGCGEKEEGHAETEAVKEIVEGGEMVKIPPTPESTPISETVGEKEPIKATSEPIEEEIPVTITPETIIYEYNEDNILNLKAIYVNGNTVTYRFGKQMIWSGKKDRVKGLNNDNLPILVKDYELRYLKGEQFLQVEYEDMENSKGLYCIRDSLGCISIFDFESPIIGKTSKRDENTWSESYRQEYNANESKWGEIIDNSGYVGKYGVVFD